MLSIIVPVYNVEATLDRCIASILDQDIEDMEIILVDDGSQDDSGKLCDQYKAQYDCIVVVHKSNGGLSDARNAGIEISRGEFISFVDSDDYIERNTYKPLLEKLMKSQELDIIEYAIKGSNRRITSFENCVFDSAKAYWLDTKGWQHSYAWNKIYKRSIFDTIRYKKGQLFEDLYLMPHIIRLNPRIMTTSSGYYHYQFNEQGLSCAKGNTIRGLWIQLVGLARAALLIKALPLGLIRDICCRIVDILRALLRLS